MHNFYIIGCYAFFYIIIAIICKSDYNKVIKIGCQDARRKKYKTRCF